MREARLRDIGEARVLLQHPLAPVDTGRAPERRFGVRLWAAMLLAAVVGGAAAAAWLMSRRESGAPVVASVRQLTESPGAEINPDISPDGRQVLYAAGPVGGRNLYLLRVGGGRAINLTSDATGDNVQGAFSPDGEQIAFRSDREGGGIFVMGATGESARRVTTAGFDPRWSPDGKRLAYATEGVNDPYSRLVRSELWSAEVETGATTRLWTGDAVQPAWSPHGERIAFWANSGGQRDIWTIAASGGQPVAVTADGATDWAPEWSPDGRWLYFISDRGGSPNVWRIPVDESSGAPRGAAEAVTNGVRPLASARFSRDGLRMVVGTWDRSFQLSLSAFDAAHPDTAGAVRTIRSQSLGWCAPSHDASWLACTTKNGQEDVVLLRADGSETRRLTDDPFKDRIPVWSPDDRTLSFMSTRSGKWELWAIGVDGSGLRQQTDLRSDLSWGTWSPDGKRMAIALESVEPYGLWFFDPSRTATRDNSEFVASGAAHVGADAWSSDGKLIAGTETNASGDPIAITVWDVEARRLVRRIELPLLRVTAIDLSFVPGTHQALTNTREGVALVDLDTGSWRVIRRIGPPLEHRLSGDGRTLLIERFELESDLWLTELRK